MARSRKLDVRTPHRRAPLTLAELVAREHRRVDQLHRELAKIRRRLARAQLRYSTFLRLQSDDARRQAAVVLPREAKAAGR